MKELTIKETIRLHRILWDRLTKTGGNSKQDAFQECPELRGLHSNFYCFACERAEQNNERCEQCIFEWFKGSSDGCYFPTSAWEKWKAVETIQERKKYAAIIRDLPLKKQYQRYLK